MNETAIAWTDRTWNPASGCERITEGCKFCYALTFAERKRGTAAFPNGFDLTIRPHKLTEPLKLKAPARIFVNSMSDLFWEAIPDEYRDRIVDVIEATPQHSYQVLTKRPEQMVAYARRRPFPTNFWAGVTIEANRHVGRADLLRQVDVPVRFISAEPLLDGLPNLDLTGIAWLITGGESGTHLHDPAIRARRALVERVDGKWRARPERVEWVRSISDRCQGAGVRFFHKQWGGLTPKSTGAELDGQLWQQWPA